MRNWCEMFFDAELSVVFALSAEASFHISKHIINCDAVRHTYVSSNSPS